MESDTSFLPPNSNAVFTMLSEQLFLDLGKIKGALVY